jgi:hypothetical protein
MDSVSNYQRLAKNTDDVRLRLILPHILKYKAYFILVDQGFFTKAKALPFFIN